MRSGVRGDMDTRPRELALFAGAGLGLLGSQMLGHRLVCAVEWNAYCQRVLMARMRDGWLDDAPIWDDVRSFDGHPWWGHVDVLAAGFPCPAFSVAGLMRAGGDPRNRWPDTARILGEVRPPVAWVENVPGLVTGRHGYFAVVLHDLAALGYDVVWGCIPAAQAGAPHKRDRVWVLGLHSDADRRRLQGIAKYDCPAQAWEQAPHRHDACGLREAVADADSLRWEFGAKCPEAGTHQALQPQIRGARSRDHWSTEPHVGRVADGVPARVDRLRALGNGQAPQQVVLAWRWCWAQASERGLI